MNKNQAAHIACARTAIYRDYQPMDIPEQIASLEVFNDRRVLATHEKDEQMESAAARAWMQDAILLAATPAPEGQADRKVEYLRQHLEGWLLSPRHADESRNYAAMIESAIAAECERWGLTASTSDRAVGCDYEFHISRVLASLMAPAWVDGHYAYLSVRTTVTAAIETFDDVKADVEALHGSGDPVVFEAALALLAVGLLELVGAAATSRAELKKKTGRIVRFGQLEPAWLVGPMVSAALRADATHLGLTAMQVAKDLAPW